jgi:hypothetical protein
MQSASAAASQSAASSEPAASAELRQVSAPEMAIAALLRVPTQARYPFCLRSGQIDADEECDIGWLWGGLNASGCDAATCLIRPGWACSQPGHGTPDIEGNVTIPGEDGLPLVLNGQVQGWGAVPYLAGISCWCNNAAGTFTTPQLDCVPSDCPFPQRCIDAVEGLANSGTVCLEGTEGDSCVRCAKRFYRFETDCRPCPTGVPVGLICVAIIGGGALLYASSVISQIATPQAIALLRSLMAYLQYLAITMNIKLRWPPWFLSVFRYLRALVNGIDLAAPECVSEAWSYHTYFILLCAGVVALFAVQAAFHQYTRWRQHQIVIVEDVTGDEVSCGTAVRQQLVRLPCAEACGWQVDNERRLEEAYLLFLQMNRTKQSSSFLLSFAYIYGAFPLWILRHACACADQRYIHLQPASHNRAAASLGLRVRLRW